MTDENTEIDVLVHVQFNASPEDGDRLGELEWAKMKARLLSTDAHYGAPLTVEDMKQFLHEVTTTLDVSLLRLPGMETATPEERLHAVAVALLEEVRPVGRMRAYEVVVEQRDEALRVLEATPDDMRQAQDIIDVQQQVIADLRLQLERSQKTVENMSDEFAARVELIEQYNTNDTLATNPPQVRHIGANALEAANQSVA
jgi:ribosomal protein S13